MPDNLPPDPLGISGTVIASKYRVEHLIGQGGHALVYRAIQTIWNEPVAIKFYRSLAQAPESARDELLAEFIQEGKLLASLSTRSAAIVQARDVGTLITQAGLWLPYMVLEWLDGSSLAAVLAHERQAGLPARDIHEVLALLEPVAVALEIAHGQNVAHRDIKPENLFVVGNPRGVGVVMKVLDFGVAKVMCGPTGTAIAALTGGGISGFTPEYGAPEQFARRYGATGPWTDVYALALVMLEVMRGGLSVLAGDDFMALAAQSSNTSVRPTPRALGLVVSSDVEAVFARALAVSPTFRFPTAGAFWTALHQAVFPDAGAWSAGLSYGGMASSPLTPMPQGAAPREALTLVKPRDPAEPPAPPASGAVPSGAARPRHWTLAIVAASVMVGAVGAAVAIPALSARWPVTTGGSALQTPGAASAASSAALPPESASAAQPAPPPACPDGMALVPGGRFFMGSDDDAFKLWQPAHKVTLDTFCFDLTEVTVEAYRACVTAGGCAIPAATPSYPKASGTSDAEHQKSLRAYAELCNYEAPERGRHPINCVSWQQADTYCQAGGKHLPTEAEWEYAARGSDGRTYPWGDEPGKGDRMNACGEECRRWERAHNLPQSTAMYPGDDGYEGTAPVGSFPSGATKLGVVDVVGNVWEWTADWFETYKPEEVINPTGARAGDRKAIRGGGFNGGIELWLNPAFRYHQLATAQSPAIGFRCAKGL